MSPLGSTHTRTGWIPHLAVIGAFAGGDCARSLHMPNAILRKRGMIAAKIETLEQNTGGASLFPSSGFRRLPGRFTYIKPLGPDVDEGVSRSREGWRMDPLSMISPQLPQGFAAVDGGKTRSLLSATWTPSVLSSAQAYNSSRSSC